MIKQLSGYENISLFFLKKIGSLIILGGVNIISQTKGRINRFLWPVKVF